LHLSKNLRGDLENVLHTLDPTVRAQLEPTLQTVLRLTGGSYMRLLKGIQHMDLSAAERASLLWTIGVLHRDEGIDVALQALEDESPAVRVSAARALMELQSRRAAPALLQVLAHDPDAQVRDAATAALGRVGSRAVVTALTHVLDNLHEDLDVRSGAAEALGDIALVKRSTAAPAVPSLLAALSDKDAWIRHDSAVALGYLREPRALSPLVALLRSDPDLRVRESAAGALGWIKSQDGLEPLLSVLENKSESLGLRQCAVSALYHIPSRSALAALLRALHDADPEIRLWSVRTLGQIRDIRAISPLQELIDRSGNMDPDSDALRDEAHDAIRRIHRKRVEA